ncbi:class I SAM-dependent methyltransferase family protein [Candidatus Woesearchaeota archaeon]|nr:class I SAM-dependent methyltransferase family protein [Candidatus Woesearchaeota archaeon]
MTSYEIIGSIALFNKKISKKEAQELIRKNKHIKTVAYKSDIHKGKYRLKKVIIILGDKNKITIHKENKVQLKVDIEKTYFSPRTSSERLRILNQIKPREDILVLFSGIGVLPIEIAKNTRAKSIIGIELNPTAHKLAQENLILNKTNNVTLYRGDVRRIVPKLKLKFDRILMPLPKSAEDFLDLTKIVIKKNTIIHFYTFAQEKEFKDLSKKLKSHFKKFKILKIVKCGNYAPFTYRICIDFKVL